MPNIADLETLEVLFALLPGLVTFLVHKALTRRERNIDATEAVLWGLAYTLLVHALWVLAKLPGSLIPTPDIVGLSLTAVALGVALSWLTNSGQGYAFLRQLGLTSGASWPTIWQSVFREFRRRVRPRANDPFPYRGQYIVVELRDGRRLLGGLVAQSDNQEDGHLVLDNYYWISGQSQQPNRRGVILIAGKDVAFVEFIPKNREDDIA
jgi:hypothetical protein